MTVDDPNEKVWHKDQSHIVPLWHTGKVLAEFYLWRRQSFWSLPKEESKCLLRVLCSHSVYFDHSFTQSSNLGHGQESSPVEVCKSFHNNHPSTKRTKSIHQYKVHQGSCKTFGDMLCLLCIILDHLQLCGLLATLLTWGGAISCFATPSWQVWTWLHMVTNSCMYSIHAQLGLHLQEQNGMSPKTGLSVQIYVWNYSEAASRIKLQLDRVSVAYFETANTKALLEGLEGSFVRASFRGVATGRADKICRICCNCPACASVSISCMFSLFSFVLISSLSKAQSPKQHRAKQTKRSQQVHWI